MDPTTVAHVTRDLREKIDHSLDHFKHELSKLRTGRANTALFEEVKVEAYGTPTPIKQLGAINVASADLVTIQPWDRNLLGPIEKAIMAADLGVTPGNDGQIIRLPIPKPSAERRKEIVKVAKKHLEETKIAMRNLRHKSMEVLKKLEKDVGLSQDERKRGEQQVQKMLDDGIVAAERACQEKEKEILEV